ncbi:MAG: M1 family metallopeptidase [Bryobacteraceae bacterium]|nr:M1 family metallopeptidase [Bryobacteraceae bacterium]
MKLTRWLAGAGTLSALFLPAALLAQMAKPIASYDLKAALDVKAHIIHGSETLVWLNDSPDTIATLRFHLYMNAFKNGKSTFLRESGRGSSGGATKDWGWIDVKSLRLEGGADLTKSIRFIQPDDANRDDQTVIEVALPEAAKPGATLRLNIAFETKLPEIIARTGYHGTFYLAGQWFPKIGVWETAGFRHAPVSAWNCHQFHAYSEFFANFGNYRAEITLPSEYKIGATGELVAKRVDAAKKTTTWTYRQESVTDFAWTAQPTYLKLERTFVAERDTRPVEIAKAVKLFGIPVSEILLSDVKITLMLQPEHAEQAERHFRAAIAGIKGFGLRYGRYPYKTLTLVDPPYGGGAASGMEYPTFITCGTSWRLPTDVLELEEVTVHEFGHQFWMQLVATNEFEESWLDEGFNTYSTSKVVEENYGASALPFRLFGVQLASLFDLPKFSGDTENRLGYQFLPDSDPILRNSWSYANGYSYGVNSYMKAGVFLLTLERLMGEQTMARVMRAYHQRYRFHHPDTYDFLQVVNEVSGRDFTSLFDQFVFHARRLDYKVDDVQSRRLGPWTGVFDEAGKRRTVTAEQAEKAEEKAAQNKSHKDLYETTVRVRREGDAVLPVEVWIHFDNGALEKRQWDGADRWAKFTFQKRAQADWVQIDPYHRHVLDVNRTNDSWQRQFPIPLTFKWGGQIAFWLQNAALWLSALV